MNRKLEELRKAAGFTQEKVAELLGLDRSTVAKWETGKAIPRLGTLKALCKLYGCRLRDLLTDEEDG